MADQLISLGRRVMNNRAVLRAGIVIGTIGFGLLVWFLRRPDQVLHPYIWAEEYEILNRFQTEGFLSSALSPVAGYFLWPTSFTVSLAAAADFSHVPLVEYWLATAWFAATLCLVLVPASSLRLRWRIGFVALLVLAPMGPEVFGVALFTFWWATLWPLISIVWSKNYWWLRIPVLIVGGMSSLAGSALLIPYAALFVMTRQRRYLVGSTVLGVTSVLQAATYISSARSQSTPIHPARVALQELRNFSDYALTWLKPTDSGFLGLAGAAILVTLLGLCIYAALRRRTPNTHELVALVLGLLIVGVLSAAPVPLVTGPIAPAPRYYFLPYVVLGWVLLLIAVTSEFRWSRLAATGMILMSLLILPQDFSLHADTVSWSDQLARCRTATNPYTVPVHTTGSIPQMWQDNLVITLDTCRRLGFQ